MPTGIELLTLTAAVGAGLVAGLCFTFGSFVLSALDRLGAAQAVRAMQSINTTILRSSAMVVWFGTALLGVAVVALTEERGMALVATALYALGAILITGRGNVPLNEALERVDPDGPEASEAWNRYRRSWSRWNTLRTAACTLASAGFAWAL